MNCKTKNVMIFMNSLRIPKKQPKMFLPEHKLKDC